MDQMQHASHSDSTHSYAEHAMASQHAGHDRHAGHSAAMFRDKFWWTLAFTIPVVTWSADVQHWLGYNAPLSQDQNGFQRFSELAYSHMAEAFFSMVHAENWPTANRA